MLRGRKLEKFDIEIISDSVFKIILCKKLYEKQAIFNAAYKYSNIAFFKLDEASDDRHVAVVIKMKNTSIDVDIDAFANEFCNEVIDQQIRFDLDIRTGEIKKLIYQKAFSALRG